MIVVAAPLNLVESIYLCRERTVVCWTLAITDRDEWRSDVDRWDLQACMWLGLREMIPKNEGHVWNRRDTSSINLWKKRNPFAEVLCCTIFIVISYSISPSRLIPFLLILPVSVSFLFLRWLNFVAAFHIRNINSRGSISWHSRICTSFVLISYWRGEISLIFSHMTY